MSDQVALNVARDSSSDPRGKLPYLENCLKFIKPGPLIYAIIVIATFGTTAILLLVYDSQHTNQHEYSLLPRIKSVWGTPIDDKYQNSRKGFIYAYTGCFVYLGFILFAAAAVRFDKEDMWGYQKWMGFSTKGPARNVAYMRLIPTIFGGFFLYDYLVNNYGFKSDSEFVFGPLVFVLVQYLLHMSHHGNRKVNLIIIGIVWIAAVQNLVVKSFWMQNTGSVGGTSWFHTDYIHTINLFLFFGFELVQYLIFVYRHIYSPNSGVLVPRDLFFLFLFDCLKWTLFILLNYFYFLRDSKAFDETVLAT